MRIRPLLMVGAPALVLALVGAPLARGQDPAPLPLDPAVRMGTLANGLTYYVRENRRPEHRAELRLVVNAGSLQEEDDQRGLAHFVEHMAFNGTRGFPKQQLVDYLESIGMRMGPDLNASTNFDETVYLLQVPTDSAALLSTGIRVLGEWAREVSFEGDEIDRERGVVREEWRVGRGAAARIRDRQLPVLLRGSRYAERPPIGDVAVIEGAPYDAVRRFYRDWYRPDLAAVIAVGDFDADLVMAEIEALFGDWQVDDRLRPREEYGVPGHDETLVSIETDPETPYGQVRVLYKLPVRTDSDRDGYRDRLLRQLYDGMLSARLSELVQSTDPPFLFGGAGYGSLVRTSHSYNLIAVVQPGGVARALTTLVTEVERIRRYGFTQAELDRMRADFLRFLGRAFNERDKTESGALAAECVRHFLTREPMPGIEFEFGFASAELPGIQLAEVNALIGRYVTSANRVIAVDGPEKDRNTLPDAATLVGILDSAASMAIEPYGDAVTDEALVPSVPARGTITERVVDERLGTTRIRLSNGVRLVMKPTDFKNDQVLMAATSPGGTSLVTDTDFLSADYADAVMGGGGVGAFGPLELRKKLAGRLVSVSPTIGEISEGLNGSATPEDLETLLQLAHLYFTAPRADSVTFESLRTRMRSLVENAGSRPESAYQDTVQVLLYERHPRRRPTTAADFDAWDLDVMERFYKDRFADAGDFTFYFVGAFDVDRLTDLAALWLGSLPSTGRVEEGLDVGARTAAGVVRRTVRRGLEPKGQVQIIFSGPAEWTHRDRRLIGVLAEAFRIRLREVLREDLGGTYGVTVGGSLTRRPYESYRFTISFGCDPAREAELIETVFSEIDALTAGGLDIDTLGKVHEARVRQLETSLRENGYWLGALRTHDDLELDPGLILEGDGPFVATLTPADLAVTALKYLSRDRYLLVTLVPEVE